MRLEFINRVEDGDILGKSILNEDGKVLLNAGVKLTSQYIEKLKEIGVFYLYLQDERLSDIFQVDEQLIEIKRNVLRCMHNVTKGLNQNSGKALKRSVREVEQLIDYVISEGPVNQSLYEIKTYDNYTYLHSIDTGIMAVLVGKAFKFNLSNLRDLGLGAVLHDIGKTQIDINIINKKDKLTDDEFKEIKKHPNLGANILKRDFSISDSVVKIVEQHHERIDGKGYPEGIQGEEINRFAKVVSVCDVYDAVSSDRSYRKRFKPNNAYELILAGTGTAFDENTVQKFKETFAVYPLGCCLKLSNGIEGYVIKQNVNFPDRPIIRVLYDSISRDPIPFYEVDLLQNINVTVEAIL